jgi:Alpha-galactosidase
MIEEKNNVFHLATAETSYVFRILENGTTEHIHYGKRLTHPFLDVEALKNKPTGLYRYYNYVDEMKGLCLDLLPSEFTFEGAGDYRTPSIAVLNVATNNRCPDFRFNAYEKRPGTVKNLSALAQATGTEEETESLILSFQDARQKLELNLVYTVFEEVNVITRRVVLKNLSKDTFIVLQAASSVLDFSSFDFSLRTLDQRLEIKEGKTVFETRANYSKSPLLMLENDREIYYLDLIYPGARKTMVEKTPSGMLHIVQGLNPDVNDMRIKSGEIFETPEAVLSYEPKNGNLKGLGPFLLHNIARGVWKNRLHPVIFNTRKTFSGEVSEDRFFKLLKTAEETGAEMIMLDDLWFGARTRDGGSLGDWSVNTMALPSGIAELAAAAHRSGLLFGLWFAPEAVSRDSILFKKHPEWIVSRQDAATYQKQYVLDITKEEVYQYLLHQLTTIVETCKIDAIRWNFNSIVSDYSATGSAAYFNEYAKALARLQKSLRAICPHLMLEGNSGGHRMDLASLCYMTELVAPKKVDISYSALFASAYSPSALCQEITSLEAFESRIFGSICYSLDFLSLDSEERKLLKEQIAFYKTYRAILQFGRFLYEERNGMKCSAPQARTEAPFWPTLQQTVSNTLCLKRKPWMKMPPMKCSRESASRVKKNITGSQAPLSNGPG